MSTVERLIRERGLPSCRIDGRIVIAREDVDAWLLVIELERRKAAPIDAGTQSFRLGAARVPPEPAAQPGRRPESEPGERQLAVTPGTEAELGTPWLSAVELARWLVGGGLAVEDAGRLVATKLGRELAEALAQF